MLLGVALVTLLVLSPVLATAEPYRPPVLGSTGLGGSTKGFGKVKPRVVYLGGDITGYVHKLHWKHWGWRRAVGWGRGYYPPPGQPSANSVAVPFQLRASHLGMCHGRRAYKRLGFYAEYGGHLRFGSTWGICGSLKGLY